MQRWVSVVLGLVAVGLAVALTWQGMSRFRPPKHVDLGDASVRLTDAGTYVFEVEGDAGEVVRVLRDGGAGYVMPDGTQVPPLPGGTPKQVRFGVVLIAYAGAEDAPRSVRSRRDAFDLAIQLASQAKTDFHAAVRRGDEGSGDDLGTMRRGVLEPAPEYVLFTLAPASVSDPVDTPRGYWIVKRIE